MNTVKGRIGLLIAILTVLSGLAIAQSPGAKAEVPPQLVATYENLADTILGAKETERNLVLSILATTYGHAEVVFSQAAAKMESNQGASAELEQLAALVSQLGNEGDAAVAAVRKRLLEGGHHHNAAGEQQGLYDPGFVIVTRAAKQVFLGAAREIGQLARTGDAAALKTQWGKVRSEYASLVEEK